MKLFHPLGFRMLLQTGLLGAISGVSLRVAPQVCGLSMYSEWQCGPNLRRVFETVLDQSMMQKDKRAIDEEEETAEINAEVLEIWELLVTKGGNNRRYCNAFLKNECVFVVVDSIADFGVQHGIGSQALADYVIGALHERTNRSSDGGDPYYSSEDDKAVDWSDGGGESEDGDGDSGEDEDSDSNHSDK